ncbi:MAG TPA: capsule assembly Wzi family protein, partial [Burkholderiaceae bacterium]
SHANAQTAETQSRDSGNGLAGIDLRLRCPFGVRCAGYAQVMGEDSRKHLPYKYLETVGAETWSADGATRLYFEASEVGCRDTWRHRSTPGCAYVNYAYRDGFTNGNRWLGASIGSDGKLLTLGWIDSDWDSELRLDWGHVGSRVGTFAYPNEPVVPGLLLWAASARRSWHIGSTTITPEFDWTKVHTATGSWDTSSRVGIEMSTTLDDLGFASPGRIGQALSSAGSPATDRLLAAGALIGGAALFDRAANSYAYDHRGEPALHVLRMTADTLPYAGLGLAGGAWLLRRGSADGDVALASVEAGLTSLALSEVIKLGVDRSRPTDDRGATDFGHARRSDSSFPSSHTALAWSVVTPIAQRYDAPWLYGAAALVNVGRVAGHKHWLSDTVAGSVLGWMVGDWFGHRAGSDTGSTVVVMPRGVLVSTDFR